MNEATRLRQLAEEKHKEIEEAVKSQNEIDRIRYIRQRQEDFERAKKYILEYAQSAALLGKTRFDVTLTGDYLINDHMKQWIESEGFTICRSQNQWHSESVCRDTGQVFEAHWTTHYGLRF